MSKSEYMNFMAALYKQWLRVKCMTEKEACAYMECESKAEGLQMISDAIESVGRLKYKH